MRSRNPGNRPPRADDRSARKQEPAATGPGVAKRKPASTTHARRANVSCRPVLARQPGA
jgi:hypothetical protein